MPISEMKKLRFREFKQSGVGVVISTKDVITSLSSGCLREKQERKLPGRKREINLLQKIPKVKRSRAWTLSKSSVYIPSVHPQDRGGENDCKRNTSRRIKSSIN